MNLEEIKSAINEGKKVNLNNSRYQVIKDKNQYLIVCDLNTRNQYCIDLTHKDGKTLNGDEKDFYINLEEKI